jgi:glycosyltransferase involved in cell wall biosynthesis
VEITGFLEASRIDAVYAQADLVLVPFRETSGSASVTQAFAHAMPILASDLVLNLELAERTPGAATFFKSEDPRDCADKIMRLLENPSALRELRAGSLAYAEAHGLQKIVERHMAFYREVMR